VTIPISDVSVVTPGGPVSAAVSSPKRRQWRFIANPKAMIGLITVGIYVLFAIIGPWIAPFDPDARSNDLLQGPSSTHWLGTSHLGQDIFSQLIYGTRGVMVVGAIAGTVAVVLSILVGITSGYLGGLMDEVLSAITNVVLVIPALPLIIIITATVPKAGELTVALSIGLTSWSWGARVLRAQTLSLRQRDYVQASKATGETTWRIIFFEIMPNLVAIIAAGFVSTVIFAVMSEITLAFIGVYNDTTWNWGTILFWAQSEQALAQGAWWWFVPAGMAIAVLGTALALLNFGIDEFVNPRLRNTGATKVRTEDGAKVRMKVGFTPVLMSRKRSQPIEDYNLDGMRDAGSRGRRAGLSSTPTPVNRPAVEQVQPTDPDATPTGPDGTRIKPVTDPLKRRRAGL
jgi:peptide/nickel transport system permease protein